MKGNINRAHPALPHVFAPELIIERGSGDYVWDSEGRKYLDLTSGIAVHPLGHCNSHIVRAMEEQAKKLAHCSNIFATPSAIDLCTKLVNLANREFGSNAFAAAFLCNSGTEANEAALKFARLFAQRKGNEKKKDLVYFENSFHGRSMGSLSVTGQPRYRDAFEPLLPRCVSVPYNDCAALRKTVNDSTAAVIVEIIQGEGGLSLLSREMADCLGELSQKYDFLVIADEVQTALYRTGPLFASTALKLCPDIISIAKSLGGGLPAGALLYGSKLQQILKVGDHGTTLGGNPLVSAVALALLEELEDPRFQQKRRESAACLDALLQKICKEQKLLTPLGRGHLRGIELSAAEAQSAVIAKIIAQCRKHRLLILQTGTRGLRIAPSLLCSKETLQEAMKILQEALRELIP